MRQRVAALPNVELWGGAQVQGVVEQDGVVQGVQVRWKDGQAEATSLPERFAGWYMPKVLDAIPDDQIVHKTFIQVQNLIVSPTALFKPKIAWRVLRHSLFG